MCVAPLPTARILGQGKINLSALSTSFLFPDYYCAIDSFIQFPFITRITLAIHFLTASKIYPVEVQTSTLVTPTSEPQPSVDTSESTRPSFLPAHPEVSAVSAPVEHLNSSRRVAPAFAPLLFRFISASPQVSLASQTSRSRPG